MLRSHFSCTQLSRARRRGTATVECAVVLSLVVVPLMIGTWEMGRFVQCQQIVSNAAREGARLAAQGRIIKTDGAPLEIKIDTDNPNVKDTVFLALVSSGLREISRTDLDVNYGGGKYAFTFEFMNILPPVANDPYPVPTQPYQAKKNQQFRITVRIPFSKVRWVNLGLVNPTYIEYRVDWQMLVDDRFTVDDNIPTW
ncbi:MAG: TadE/TadG family type IV pilus assembly protein [Gemmataceae bacterium]